MTISDAMPTARLTEMFSSIQGEGPYVGLRQLFVRFYGCHRRCVYCDSPETVTAWQPPGHQPSHFRLEQTPGHRDFSDEPNPVTPDHLVALCARFERPPGLHHAIAFTGGEPLLHAGFLRETLPRLRERGWRSYLETAGDLYHELEKVLPVLDYCAMDIKLPSVTANEAAWGSHRKFLERCRDAGIDTFVKVIVSAETAPEDIREAVAVVADIAPALPFILQPMTPFGPARNAPSAAQLLQWQETARERLPDVRVIPQCHKMMGQL
ncbi:MAG TPA: 7-carboxy-7-deazaguanine synthase QueE [Kiritimatiellia bacterium]|nr:7-carboxy-7-deazaguanine synthase QueE [Kiritimatiellia bacterium]